MAVARPLLTKVRQRQSTIVRSFLWTLLGIVTLTMLINLMWLGGAGLTLRTLAPNLTFCAVIGVALWFARREQIGRAVGLVAGLVLGSVALHTFGSGVEPSGAVLALLFVPVVLVGLLQERRALYLTSGAGLAILLLPPALSTVGVRPTLGPVGPVWATSLQFALILAIVMFFLDRIGATSREALMTSLEREEALEREVEERRQVETRLRDEQSLNEAIVNNFPGVFYVVREDGTYVQWNKNFAHVLGYDDEEELLQKPSSELLADVNEEQLSAARVDTLRTGTGSLKAALVTKDGRKLPYFLTGARIDMSDATYIAGIGVDIGELTEAQERIERLNRKMAGRLEHITALREIDRTILGSLDLDLTLNVILDKVTQQLGMDAGMVLLYKPNSHTLRHGAEHGFHSPADRTFTLQLGESPAGRVALERETTMISDPSEFDRSFRRAPRLRAEGFTVYTAAPLVAKGKLLGVLELFHRDAFEASEEWLSFLDALTAQVAIALSSALMFENLERSNSDLRMAYDTTIEGWAQALDLKDEETEGHSRRVMELTVKLAEQAGVPEEELVHVRRGALLHDIGKMGVPDAILLKPGKLDAEEWKVMKQHTTFAFDLLSPIPFLRSALDIPYCHHEKWDGSGYPRGLKGEQIPLAARLFAVVDVYDALTSDRPYRAAWSEERALDFIREQAGTHFDPAAVDTFFRLGGGTSTAGDAIASHSQRTSSMGAAGEA